MNQLKAKDMQDAGLLVAKMAAEGAKPLAIVVVGLVKESSEIVAGTLWLQTIPETARAYIAECAKGSIMEQPFPTEAGKDGCVACSDLGHNCGQHGGA